MVKKMKNRLNLKCCVPFLCVFSFLICCLPVVSSHAASPAASLELSGTYQFNSVLSGDDAFQDISFTCDGRSYDSIEFSGGSLYYDSLEAYRPGTGWLDVDYRYIDFGSSPQPIYMEFDDWFSANASSYSPPPLLHTYITIGSTVYTFLAEQGAVYSPEVEFEVTQDGCIMTDENGEVKQWLASGSYVFLGFSATPSASSIDFYPGDFGSFGGNPSDFYAYLYPVYDTVAPDPDPDPDPGSSFSTSITVGSSTVVCSGTSTASPTVDVTVTASGLTLSYLGNVRSLPITSFTGGTFLGISTSPNASTPMYAVGDQFSCTGVTGSDVSYQYYPVFDFVFINVIYVNGSRYVFPGNGSASPDVTMTVTDSGAIFTSGDLIRHWSSPAGDSFLGFSTVDGGAISIFPGNTYTFPGASGSDVDYELFTPDAVRNYNTVVRIDDHVFTFSNTVGLKPVTVTVTEYGVTMTDGDRTLHWYPDGLREFLGLSLSNGSNDVFYESGDSFIVFGTPSLVGVNQVYEQQFYSVYGGKTSLLPGADFASWLVTAIGGFLGFELVPGFSLQDILSFVLLFGILLWVLKIALR